MGIYTFPNEWQTCNIILFVFQSKPKTAQVIRRSALNGHVSVSARRSPRRSVYRRDAQAGPTYRVFSKIQPLELPVQDLQKHQRVGVQTDGRVGLPCNTRRSVQCNFLHLAPLTPLLLLLRLACIFKLMAIHI